MWQILIEDLKTVIVVALVIVVTQTLFFMVYSYCMSEDVLIGLKNFYNIMYNIR